MLTVLFENSDILIIDKPAGLASQPGERVGASVVTLVERQFGFKLYPVHRLDKETAGCMMLAKSSRASSVWSERLSERKIRKIYWAVSFGTPPRDKGAFSDSLDYQGKSQKAETFYRVLRTFNPENLSQNGVGGAGWEALPMSLLELELGSGRMHQIRRHLALHDLPILGDDKYGNFRLNKQIKSLLGVKNLLLWARQLEIPGIGAVVSAQPEHFSKFFAVWDDEEPGKTVDSALSGGQL